MKTVFATTFLLLLAGPAVAQSTTEKTGINSLIGVAPKTEDFVQEAAASDMFEIASSKLAVERSDAPTKAFAETMIKDHEKTTAELKQLVNGGSVKASLPTAMSSSQKKMIDSLQGLQGSDFTKEYHSDQVSAHKDAVDLFKRYGENGENSALESWAMKTRPALEHHLTMAEDLNK